MSRRHTLTGLALAVALAVCPGTAVAADNPTGPHATDTGAVAVTGSVHHPKRLTVAELNAMPQHTKEVAFGVGPERSNHTFKGALLYDVLNGAGPAVDPKAKGDLQRFVITVVGADGYAAALAWGEIDPNLENKMVLLATVADGKSLTRPELVVPFDTKGGRYINDVVRVDVSRPTLRGPKPHKR
ncbi:MAG TPA: molybdopterin-dependent oxidoreductase [Sporichthyaceae bacterium]|nr:molybdopterin-dependent oxidoreductase [Sporichthyaceae bacterium]